MEFWSALLGAVIGAGASWAAAVYTLRRTADHAEKAWHRDKKADALEELDLLVSVVMTKAASPTGAMDREHLDLVLEGEEWTRATRKVLVYVPSLHREVHALTDAFWEYANGQTEDEMVLDYARSEFQAGMRRELGLKSVSEATGKAPRALPPGDTGTS